MYLFDQVVMNRQNECYLFSPVNIWYDLKQIATEFFSTGMHSGEVSL